MVAVIVAAFTVKPQVPFSWRRENIYKRMKKKSDQFLELKLKNFFYSITTEHSVVPSKFTKEADIPHD